MADQLSTAPRAPETVEASPEDGSGVERCVSVIRQMIFSGELAPGQKMHQADLAEKLQVSRVPIREALARLHAEGLLAHKSNAGFTVARFSTDGLAEIYLMRRLLETQLLLTADLASIDVSALANLNARLLEAAAQDRSDVFQRLNVEFHFMIFAASPLTLVRQEVARLWNMSAYFRSLRLMVNHDPEHICNEHESILDAIRRGSTEDLIALMDRHRSGTERAPIPIPGHHARE